MKSWVCSRTKQQQQQQKQQQEGKLFQFKLPDYILYYYIIIIILRKHTTKILYIYIFFDIYDIIQEK